jgi:hypothetical protein
MLDHLNLTLLIGPLVPLPAPKAVIDALTSISVTTSSVPKTPSAFELQFTLDNTSALQTLFLLSGGAQLPIFRVIVIVTVNGTPDVLIDGVVTKQQVTPGQDAGHSTLSITGVDLTAVMGLVDFSGIPYPALPPEAQVLLILAKYAFLGVVPLVIPSIVPEVESPTSRFDSQVGKDLEYVHKLADETGYVFYLSPGPVPGANVAYWGPQVKVGVPQPALNVDMDSAKNVESLTFSFDAEHKVLPIVVIQNAATKIPIPIPIPDITPLSPPLGLIPPIPKRIEPIPGTGNLSPARAVLLGMAKAAQSANAVKGEGSLDVLRYGRVLKARELVGVRGVGMAFDGLYFVESVTHTIKPHEYKQRFTLARNGLVSTVPAVPA